jgi:di/tricarboxylate transporter
MAGSATRGEPHLTPHQALSFALLAAAVVLFAWGRFRYDLVSLAVLLAAVLVGVVPADRAFAGFSNEIVVIIASALVVSAAMQRSGVVERALQPILPHLTRESLQVPVLVAATTLLSMVTKNVGALAMLMPVALQVARRTGTAPSRLLMPMSFGSLLGGLVTLIGTSPNIIVSEVRQQVQGRPFELFDFAPVGLGLAALGLVFLSVGYRFLPRQRAGQAELSAALDASGYTAEARVPAEAPVAGRRLADLSALAAGRVKITALLRQGRHATAPLADAEVGPGDAVLLEGEQEAIDQVMSAAKLELAQPRAELERETPAEEIRTVEAVVGARSPLIGLSAKRADLQSRFGVKLLAVGRQGERITEQLRNLILRAGDVLVLRAGERTLPASLAELNLLPLAAREVRLGASHRSLLPAAVLAAAMALVAFRVLPITVAFFGAAVVMAASGAITMREAYDKLDGQVLVLIGALVPVSEAVRASGGTELVAHAISGFLAGVPPLGAVAILMVAAMITAPFLHNVPTVLVLGPLAASVAHDLHLRPEAFLMAVATGAACDFLTPIGHQCNTLVMGPGGYRFTDYPRLGAPLSLLVIVVGAPLILAVWPLR